jgi:pyruvate/2-oxoglutarate dehydrogenase complex dihydrolipoamide dehydrogenase (E3) component
MQRRKSASQRQNGGWGMYFAAKNIVRSVFATGRSARLPFLRHLQAIYAQREKESCAMKTQVKALVVGGGAVGTSIAYHLGKRGWDTMLIERDELTSGSTWHAAGLLPLFNMSYATDAYPQILG